MYGEKIKAERIKKGLLQQELADKIKVSKSTVAMWETNRRIPDTKTLKEIADALECPANVFLDDTVEFDFVPHEDEEAVITCPICGYDYSFFSRTVNVKFNNEKSFGIALEFRGECEHTFYLVVESYKGNSYIVKSSANCLVPQRMDIAEESVPEPITESGTTNSNLLIKYNQLDRHGKDIVKTILDKEFERCAGEE